MSLAHKDKLIELVKSQPGLWLQSRKAPGLKQKIWDQIGNELNISGYDARRQWEILRDQLRRETKRYKQIPNYESKWIFFSKMRFMLQERDTPTAAAMFSDNGQSNENLNYQIISKSTESGCGVTKSDVKPLIIQVRQDLQEPNDSSILPTPDMHSSAIGYEGASTSAGVSSSSQVPECKLDYEGSDYNEIKENPQKPCPPDSIEDEDGDYYFALSIVPSLKYIRKVNKLRVRSKIMDIIATALEEEESNMEEARGREDDEDEYEDKYSPSDMVQTYMD